MVPVRNLGTSTTQEMPGETLAMNQIFREQKMAVRGGGGERAVCY